VPVDELLRFNVVPNLPAPWSQTLELILTEAAGSMMHVPGGMIIVALPRLEYEAELRAAWSAAESSVTPSHFMPVAKTGFMMHVLLMAQASLGSATLVENRAGACADALPNELRITHNAESTQPLKWSLRGDLLEYLETSVLCWKAMLLGHSTQVSTMAGHQRLL
jgi:hypothetical protein